MPPTPIIVSWSGGKDCLLALERLRADERWDVRGLVTMVTDSDRRVSMHAIPEHWLQRQAEALGLPLATIPVPRWPSNDVYRSAFAQGIAAFRAAGVQTIAFGDLFLEDIRIFREELCAQLGWTPVFPVWGADTDRLAEEFVAGPYRAVVCCVDASQLTADFVGCGYDAAFLSRLPAGVDPCGERGEFHTFVSAGPGWGDDWELATGRSVRSEGFIWMEWSTADTARPVSAEGLASERESVDVW